MDIEKRIIDICKERKQNGERNIYPYVAEKIFKEFNINMTHEQLREISRKYRRKNDLDENFNIISEKESFKSNYTINNDGSQTSEKILKINEKDIKNPNFLLKSHGFDEKEWTLINAKSSTWNVHSNKDGVKDLYASKITVKPIVEDINLEKIKEHFENFSKGYESPVVKPTNYSKDGKMLEVNLADLHIGKLAHIGDSGENYDHKIARKRFLFIINDIIERTKNYKFEKILFVWSQDFFHSDNINDSTSSNTPLHVDVRWQKLFLKGIELLVEGIDLLSQQAPVETFYIGSNHDKMTSFHAICYLNAWYKDNPNVTIDTATLSRKYIEYGKCLIGFAHGSNIKKLKIGKLMPVEAREAWGRTFYHEMHNAHFHSEQTTTEENGIIVRYISSPTGTDNWHYEKGFVGAVKKSEHFVWDRELGLMEILMTNILEKED